MLSENEGMKLPGLSLQQEYNAYVITNRNEKAKKIKALIDSHYFKRGI